MIEEDIHIHLTPSYRREIEKKLISEFLSDLDSNMWIKDIVKKWEGKLKDG